MVIWSGWGILVVPVTLLVGGGVTVLFGALLNAAGLGRLAGFALVAGLLAAAAANWWVGRWLNGRPGRVLLDPATGQQVVLRRRHSLFFIPAQWWAVPLAVAAAIAFVSILVGPGPSAASPGLQPDAVRSRSL
ncbi:MAG TPA: hypothetical protein VGC15_03140 [Acetobacteraceae bacterium]